ncbi:hypothetical protein [Halochromatium glycolicum]|uniref:hypothetical protein n=1 Tax=Halochromatium glycolicum TaxID=85075 RepID=UPI00190BDD66|nr:hypothetical protein [Halochromatium glycolicum]
MSELKVGNKIKDNDPRTNNRVLQVIGIDDTHCRCRHPGYPAYPDVRIRIDRIHSDGKPRRSGFDLIA